MVESVVVAPHCKRGMSLKFEGVNGELYLREGIMPRTNKRVELLKKRRKAIAEGIDAVTRGARLNQAQKRVASMPSGEGKGLNEGMRASVNAGLQKKNKPVTNAGGQRRVSKNERPHASGEELAKAGRLRSVLGSVGKVRSKLETKSKQASKKAAGITKRLSTLGKRKKK